MLAYALNVGNVFFYLSKADRWLCMPLDSLGNLVHKRLLFSGLQFIKPILAFPIQSRKLDLLPRPLQNFLF